MLDRILLPGELLHAGMCHALVTDAEEVMGLVLGVFEDRVAVVTHMLVMERSDKLKDRVEISPEQLAFAQTQAEQFGVQIVGWYHSHPKITYLASHIDLGTQRLLQTMDDRFFGLIYACYYHHDHAHRVTLTAFQSTERQENRPVPVQIVPTSRLPVDASLSPSCQLPRLYFEEHQRAYRDALADSQRSRQTALPSESPRAPTAAPARQPEAQADRAESAESIHRAEHAESPQQADSPASPPHAAPSELPPLQAKADGQNGELALALAACAADAQYERALVQLTYALCAPMLTDLLDRKRQRTQAVKDLEIEIAALEARLHPKPTTDSLL